MVRDRTVGATYFALGLLRIVTGKSLTCIYFTLKKLYQSYRRTRMNEHIKHI